MPVAQKNPAANRKPPMHVSEADYDRIADMAIRMAAQAPELSKLIMDELDRARLHTNRTLPKDVVALNAEVEFEDTSSNARRRVRLVMPADADLTEACI